MNSIKISEFKAGCIAMLNKLRKKGADPFIVTSRGDPIAIIYPYEVPVRKRKLGSQKGAVKVTGDIVNVDFSSDWDALK